jgi:hypothetical protein
LQSAAYFGRIEGSPPGLPGGGITGVLPVSGVGARISGSTPEGGHITPSDLASLSPSGSLDERPTVDPSGVVAPAAFGIGAQLAGRADEGGAVCCGGVATVGGCCARTAPSDAASTHVISNAGVILMLTERTPRADVPLKRQDLR